MKTIWMPQPGMGDVRDSPGFGGSLSDVPVEIQHRAAIMTSRPEQLQTKAVRGPTRGPALLLGIGLGGFIDGIVIHQILQWHHMISHTEGNPVTTVAGLEANTLADGFFHVATWIFVVVGSTLMLVAWRQGRRAPSWRFHIGLLIAGWGIFNLVEGVINHQILGIHHLRDDLGAPLSWDIGFLLFGALLVVGGWALHRSDPVR